MVTFNKNLLKLVLQAVVMIIQGIISNMVDNEEGV